MTDLRVIRSACGHQLQLKSFVCLLARTGECWQMLKANRSYPAVERQQFPKAYKEQDSITIRCGKHSHQCAVGLTNFNGIACKFHHRSGDGDTGCNDTMTTFIDLLAGYDICLSTNISSA